MGTNLVAKWSRYVKGRPGCEDINAFGGCPWVFLVIVLFRLVFVLGVEVALRT